MANPYLIIETCGYKKQSRVYDKKVNVVFAEIKVFNKIQLSRKEYNHATIDFKMMHSNGMIRKPMFIGECSVDLSAVHNRSTHEVKGR